MKTYNLKRAAKFLHMSQSSLRQKAKVGEIPGSKPGKKWVFLLSDLIAYLQAQSDSIAAEAKKRADEPSCLSIDAKTLGGYALPRRMEPEYASLLGLQTGSRHRSITTK